MYREYAASLRADQMRDWARHAPEPRHRVDRGGLPVTENLPDSPVVTAREEQP